MPPDPMSQELDISQRRSQSRGDRWTDRCCLDHSEFGALLVAAKEKGKSHSTRLACGSGLKLTCPL